MARRSKSKSSSEALMTIIVVLIAVYVLVHVLLPLAVVVGIGYGFYRLIRYMYMRQKKRQEQLTNPTADIERLQGDIRQADYQLKKLDTLWEDEDFDAYRQLADKLLPSIQHIESELNQLKEHINATTYQRVKAHAKASYDEVKDRLSSLVTKEEDKRELTIEERVATYAPELKTTYDNIMRDYETILEKIKKADNKEELLALHQASMNRFEDVLTGYLKIKQSPKDYYKADERLETARLVLVQFDEDLDETLRQLNESDMKDFDISLRLMKDKLEND
ncbi:hypothetical protein [Streptococcus sciuri]|uniref:Membrane associated protein n=1 Tax=Streptococcus sciuri TaxID=2973939 RepID=A0ABT2FAC3_9STRE|nr:hypothetical protein [Streptococcus sciuri]MCS4488790.1 hypothetical protein [Streptococcus sciuri]